MDCLWLAEVGDRVVGMIDVVRTTPRVASIRQFRVDPEWQHTSIPRNLIDRVREYCWSHGCTKLVAEAGSAPGWFFTLLSRFAPRTSSRSSESGLRMHEFNLAANEPVTRSADAEQPRPLRVLLADDHSVLRKGISDLLREHPEIEVVAEAGDGQQALEMAIEFHPDVVLMDVTMPQMDGIEATRRILAKLPDINIIGLSMHEGEEVAAAMRDAGAKEYLCKSDSSDAIVAAVLQCA